MVPSLRASVVSLLLVSCVPVAAGCKSRGTVESDGDHPSRAAQAALMAPFVSARGVDTTIVPVDFPSVVPLYPGARVIAATRSVGRANKDWIELLETTDDRDRAFDFFREKLTAFGKTDDRIVGTKRTGVWKNSQYDVLVTADDAPGKSTSMTVVVIGR